eukprot:TRINITY_DN742_c0_g1_i1.p1 TRINITY_DN742_c0_g1~~TRINITY_DN742_c0_g1_i1.p1  ORF type:complete len:509 (+),score=132.70 TRINITY_DN742_c0_g1_i1:37-1527(+)
MLRFSLVSGQRQNRTSLRRRIRQMRMATSDPAQDNIVEIRNPALGGVIDNVTYDSPQDVEDKLETAREGVTALRDLGMDGRIDIMTKFGSLLAERRTELAGLMTKETGKPISQSLNEIDGTVERVEYFTNNVRDVLNEKVVGEFGSMKEVIRYEPLGVIANISAWNYPYFVGSNVFVPALLTGNSVLYKPSEHSILTGIKIGELLHEAGIPQNAFIPVLGEGEVGNTLIRSKAIEGIFFTGSYKTGLKIAETAFQNKLVERIQLELGGKDPVYVHNDVDIPSAAASVLDGIFYNNGQGCCSLERVYVHEDIHDAFVEALVEHLATLKIGDPSDPDVYFGPLTRHKHVKYLLKQIEDAKANGGVVVTGGKRIESKEQTAYLEPTIITNANHEMLLMTEESFGPIAGVMAVKSPEEAITLMNDTQYGLTAAVYSKDREVANNVLSKVNSGTSYWNCCDRVSPRLPWTGRKGSGIGTTLSQEGIKTFVIPKAWHIRSLD